MPRYEYRCRACGDTFERTRPMSESSAPCPCPQGHDDTVKLLSTVAVGGRASSAPAPRGGWGGGWRGGRRALRLPLTGLAGEPLDLPHLVRGVQRRDLVRLGQRRVVEHGVHQVVDG